MACPQHCCPEEEIVHNPKGGGEDGPHVFASEEGSSTNPWSDTKVPSASKNNKREPPSEFSNPAKKRRVDKPERDGDDEDGANNDDKNCSSSSANKPRLACPFFKRKPTKTRPSCVYPGFSSIARLKEHLYRQHMLPAHQCSRCLERFKTDGELREHSRATVPCAINESATPEGITMEQEKALKSKKRTGKSGVINNEEEKWRDVYAILFPDEDIPPPYCDPISPPSLYEDFLRKELPVLVKNHLYNWDRKLDTTKDESRDQIATLVGDCQDEVFALWNRNTSWAASEQVSSTMTEVRSKSPPTRDDLLEGSSNVATSAIKHDDVKSEKDSPSPESVIFTGLDEP